ncbi:hypothetical protein [Microbacterium oleivorans]|uniref:Uncharacterized protein n=1 Tax=Microbacterium oleivorans TaxID=273677 RepID=A0A7D5F6M7_9MICO|nr:hypothetical protein [Microbacterium oleivorans]QLD11473.1 hypothetical protein HW566_06620 [Microbacterium oleivorans]
MKLRAPAIFACAVLLFGALLPSPASAASDQEIPDWVDVPPGATVEVISAEPGQEVYLVTEKTPDAEILAPKALPVGGRMQVATGAETTTYQQVAAACTQTQTMTNPLANITGEQLRNLVHPREVLLLA